MPAKPMISVILPVYAVEEYLGACLDSILGAQTGGRTGTASTAGTAGTAGTAELEVIAVDDASPDGCGAMLDARARRDPRLRVLHLSSNGGPGHARNEGLALATGEYVWFVDADDQAAEGALEAITQRLRRDRPDVLLIDYEELEPGGRTAPSPGRDLLRRAPEGPFTLAGQPQLIQLTMTSWSKLIRRAFLDLTGLSFPAGIHEDVALTCALLLGAERIGALPRVCYRYRQRPGSFMATASTAQLSIFRSYETVFALVAAAGPAVPGPVRAAVFERAIWHYTTVLGGRRGSGGLVPRGSRRAFFQRMHEDFARYRPADYRNPSGFRGVKFWLVERNAYGLFCALEPVNRLRVVLSRAASRLRRG
jgi:CDP-glycerol glycerophosphotransferase